MTDSKAKLHDYGNVNLNVAKQSFADFKRNSLSLAFRDPYDVYSQGGYKLRPKLNADITDGYGVNATARVGGDITKPVRFYTDTSKEPPTVFGSDYPAFEKAEQSYRQTNTSVIAASIAVGIASGIASTVVLERIRPGLGKGLAPVALGAAAALVTSEGDLRSMAVGALVGSTASYFINKVPPGNLVVAALDKAMPGSGKYLSGVLAGAALGYMLSSSAGSAELEIQGRGGDYKLDGKPEAFKVPDGMGYIPKDVFLSDKSVLAGVESADEKGKPRIARYRNPNDLAHAYSYKLGKEDLPNYFESDFIDMRSDSDYSATAGDTNSFDFITPGFAGITAMWMSGAAFSTVAKKIAPDNTNVIAQSVRNIAGFLGGLDEMNHEDESFKSLAKQALSALRSGKGSDAKKLVGSAGKFLVEEALYKAKGLALRGLIGLAAGAALYNYQSRREKGIAGGQDAFDPYKVSAFPNKFEMIVDKSYLDGGFESLSPEAQHRVKSDMLAHYGVITQSESGGAIYFDYKSYGNAFYSAVKGLEKGTLIGAFYDLNVSPNTARMLADRASPNNFTVSGGENFLNLMGVLEGGVEMGTALTYRLFNPGAQMPGYGKAVNSLGRLFGIENIYDYQQGTQSANNEALAKVANFAGYAALGGAASLVAGGLISKYKPNFKYGKLAVAGGLAAGLLGAAFASTTIDESGDAYSDIAYKHTVGGITSMYNTWADTGQETGAYSYVIGGLIGAAAGGLVGGSIAKAMGSKGLPGLLAGLAIGGVAGAAVNATRMSRVIKYGFGGDAPEKGGITFSVIKSRDAYRVREIANIKEADPIAIVHSKVAATTAEAKQQWAYVSTGNLGQMERSARGERNQFNIALQYTDKERVSAIRQAITYINERARAVVTGGAIPATPNIKDIIFGGVGGDSGRKIKDLVTKSKGSLDIVFPYATDQDFFNSIKQQMATGRKMRIFMQSPYGVQGGGKKELTASLNTNLMEYADVLEKSGVDVNVEFYAVPESKNFLLHAKAIISDTFAAVGSHNFSFNSINRVLELIVVDRNQSTIKGIRQSLSELITEGLVVKVPYQREKEAERRRILTQQEKSMPVKSLYDLGIFANLHRPNYSLKDSSTLTSIGAAQVARSTMPGIAYLPNKLSNQFFLDNRGQRPNLFQNWFYMMTGTAPSTDKLLGIGPSQAEVLEQADAQLSPFLSLNPTKWGETRGVGVLFNEKVGGEFYVDGSGITGNLAKGLGRVLDIATGYYGLARLHELRTGQAPRDDIKLLHQQQGTSKPDRGFFESLLSETVDTVRATATSLLFYFGFSHALSLVQQHVETVGLNSVLNAITATEGSARREQLKMLVSAPQLRVLQSAYTIKNAVEEGSSLKMLSASFQSIFDTASMRAVEEVTGNKDIARGLVNAERVDELTSYLSNQAKITPTNSTFSAGVYDDIAAMKGRISRLLKAEGITPTSAEVDVQSALQKVLATHLGYDQGSGTLSLDKPLFNDKLTFAERGGMARLGSLRRIDSSNFRQALRPILESIALPRDQAKFTGALEAFDELISAQPSIQFIDDNTASPVQFINYGMERLKDVATQLDKIASDIPANPFLWSPAIRSALNITSLDVQQDGRDLSLKSFLGSGSFEAMIKTQKEIFRTIQNIASKGLFREIAQARAVFAISDSLAKQETMIAAKLAENLSQTNVTALQQLITNYSEERLEFTAAVKAGNRSLEPTDIQQSGYKRTRKLLMGMGAILVGDAVIDRYFLQNEGGDFFNQLQRFSIASQLVKDSDSPYAGDDRTEQERIYNTEFTGVVPRYLRAPIILAGAYAGGKLGFDVRYSDTLSNIKETDIAKLDSLGDEVTKLKDLFTQSNKRLVTKFSNLGAYFGAMTAIMGTQLAFSAAAAAANTARTAWHSEGLKMQGEGAVAAGKIAVALRNTLGQYAAREFADQPQATEAQVVNDLFTKDKATATRMAVATLMAEGIAKSQTEGMRPQYTFAHQIPNPIFQLAFVGKLDPKGETISIGAGFQFLPLLGAGSIPALPLSMRTKPPKDIRHLVAREIDYRDQETGTQQDGYWWSRLFGHLTSGLVFDPNSQLTAVLGVAAGANVVRSAASSFAGKLQPNAELAEIYKGTKVVRDGAMFVADQSEKLMRWSQAPMLAAPNSAFKALASVFASYDSDYPSLLTAIGPKARTATAFLLPLLFASASMSFGSTYDYIGTGIEALSGQTKDAEQSYAEGLNNARWYRAGGVLSTTAIYGISLYKFGAFKPAKSFSGGINGTVLRQIYERGAAQGLSQMRKAEGASTFLGNVSLFEQEVAAGVNVNADELDARFAKRLVNEFEAQEQALKKVFDAAGVDQYAFLHNQTDESETAVKRVLKQAIEANIFTDTDSVFGRFMRESFGDLHKTVGTHEFTSNLDDYTNVAYNRFKAQSKEAIKLAQKIEPSMYHTAPRRIGVIATAIAIPFVAMNIMASLLVDSDTFVEKPSDGFLMGLAKVPLLLASGTSAEHRMSAEAKQKIASYRQGVGLSGRPEAPKSLGDTLLGLLELINPVRIFNPVSPYKDDPKPFFNVIGPIGMSEGSRGWTHYTQVQSMAADASTSQYYMQAAVFQSADAAAIRAVNKLDPQTDLDVINAWRAKQARQKPMSLKGTASRSESQAVSGATPALAMALAQRQSAATWLSYQHADDIKNDFLMQMLYTGRVMNATVGNVPFKADYLGWTPFDAGLISEFIVGGTLGQPSDAAQKLQTFTSAVKGAGNWLATGDFRDQFDYSLFNKTSNTQTQSPIPLIGTFIDLGRYVVGSFFDDQTKKFNPLATFAATTAVTAFGLTLFGASIGSLYFAGSAVTAALAAYKEGGDYRNLTSNIQENIDQISAKSLVARFDNTGQYGRLMLTNDRIMHTGGRVLRVFDQALDADVDGRALASGVTGIINQFNQDLAAIGALNSSRLAEAVKGSKASDIIDFVKEDLVRAFDKALPQISGQDLTLAQLLKFNKTEAFLKSTEYSGVFNKLETNLHTIFNSKMDGQLKVVRAQEMLTKSLLDIKQSVYRGSGENDLSYTPSRYGKGHSTDADLAFKSRLLYKETDYYAESLGELVSRYGAAGTLGRAALGVGSIAGSYLDVAQTWYPLLTATTALGADKRSDRVRAAQVLGSYTFETGASVAIARLLRKAPGKTIAGAIAVGVLAGIDKTLLKGEMWNTVQRFARVTDQKLIRPIENIVTGAATFLSDIPLFRGIAKPLGIPFRALDPFINNLHQKAEGTGWANFTMFFLPHTVESRYNMSAQSSMGMETAFGTRPYEISSEETRQHQQQLADQRFNRAISVNKKPDEQLVSHELLGGQATLEAQIFYDKHLDNKGYLVDRVMSDFGPRSQLSSLMIVAASARAYEADYVDARRTREMLPTTSYGLAYAALETVSSLEAISRAKYGDPHKLFFRAAEKGVLAVNEMILFQHHAKGIVRQGASDVFGRLARLLPGRAGDVNKIASGNIMLSALPKIMGVGAVTAFTYYSLTDGDNEQLEKNALGFTLFAGGASGATSFLTSTTGKNLMLKGLAKTAVVKDWAEKNKVAEKAKGWSNKMPESLAWGALFGVAMSGNVHTGLNFVANLFADPEEVEARKAKGEDTVPGGTSLIASIVGFTGWMAATRAKYNYTETRDHLANLREFKTPKSVNTWVGRAVIGAFIGQLIGQGIGHGIEAATSFLNLTAVGAMPSTEQEKENKGWFIAGMGAVGAVTTSAAFIKSKSLLEGINTVAHATLSLAKWPALWIKDGLSWLVKKMPDGSKAREVYNTADDFVVSATDPNLKGGLLRNFKAGALKRLHHFSPQFKAVKRALTPLVPMAMHTGVDSFLALASFMQVGKVDILSRQSEAHAATKGALDQMLNVASAGLLANAGLASLGTTMALQSTLTPYLGEVWGDQFIDQQLAGGKGFGVKEGLQTGLAVTTVGVTGIRAAQAYGVSAATALAEWAAPLAVAGDIIALTASQITQPIYRSKMTSPMAGRHYERVIRMQQEQVAGSLMMGVGLGAGAKGLPFAAAGLFSFVYSATKTEEHKLIHAGLLTKEDYQGANTWRQNAGLFAGVLAAAGYAAITGGRGISQFAHISRTVAAVAVGADAGGNLGYDAYIAANKPKHEDDNPLDIFGGAFNSLLINVAIPLLIPTILRKTANQYGVMKGHTLNARTIAGYKRDTLVTVDVLSSIAKTIQDDMGVKPDQQIGLTPRVTVDPNVLATEGTPIVAPPRVPPVQAPGTQSFVKDGTVLTEYDKAKQFIDVTPANLNRIDSLPLAYRTMLHEVVHHRNALAGATTPEQAYGRYQVRESLNPLRSRLRQNTADSYTVIWRALESTLQGYKPEDLEALTNADVGDAGRQKLVITVLDEISAAASDQRAGRTIQGFGNNKYDRFDTTEKVNDIKQLDELVKANKSVWFISDILEAEGFSYQDILNDKIKVDAAKPVTKESTVIEVGKTPSVPTTATPATAPSRTTTQPTTLSTTGQPIVASSTATGKATEVPTPPVATPQPAPGSTTVINKTVEATPPPIPGSSSDVSSPTYVPTSKTPTSPPTQKSAVIYEYLEGPVTGYSERPGYTEGDLMAPFMYHSSNVGNSSKTYVNTFEALVSSNLEEEGKRTAAELKRVYSLQHNPKTRVSEEEWTKLERNAKQQRADYIRKTSPASSITDTTKTNAYTKTSSLAGTYKNINLVKHPNHPGVNFTKSQEGLLVQFKGITDDGRFAYIENHVFVGYYRGHVGSEKGIDNIGISRIFAVEVSSFKDSQSALSYLEAQYESLKQQNPDHLYAGELITDFSKSQSAEVYSRKQKATPAPTKPEDVIPSVVEIVQKTVEVKPTPRSVPTQQGLKVPIYERYSSPDHLKDSRMLSEHTSVGRQMYDMSGGFSSGQQFSNILPHMDNYLEGKILSINNIGDMKTGLFLVTPKDKKASGFDPYIRVEHLWDIARDEGGRTGAAAKRTYFIPLNTFKGDTLEAKATAAYDYFQKEYATKLQELAATNPNAIDPYMQQAGHGQYLAWQQNRLGDQGFLFTDSPTLTVKVPEITVKTLEVKKPAPPAPPKPQPIPPLPQTVSSQPAPTVKPTVPDSSIKRAVSTKKIIDDYAANPAKFIEANASRITFLKPGGLDRANIYSVASKADSTFFAYEQGGNYFLLVNQTVKKWKRSLRDQLIDKGYGQERPPGLYTLYKNDNGTFEEDVIYNPSKQSDDGGFFKLTKGSGRGTKPVEVFSRLIKSIGSDIASNVKSFFSNLARLTELEVEVPARTPRFRQPIGLDDIDLAIGLTSQPPRQPALPDYQPLLKPVSEAELQSSIFRQPRAEITAMDGAESIPNSLIYEEPLRPRYSVDATPEQFAHLQQSMSTTKMGGKTWIKPYAPKEALQPTQPVGVKPSYAQAADPWDNPAPQQLKPKVIVDAEAARLQSEIETLGSDLARLDKRSTNLNAAADNTDLKLAQALQQANQSQYDSTVMTGYDYADKSARVPIPARVNAPVRLGVGGAVKTGFKTGIKAGLADIGVQASRSGVKLSFSQFKAGQLGKVNIITTGLDTGVTVVEGMLRGDSWGTTAKKAGWSLLSGLAFGAVMQGAVAGITAGLTAVGAAGAAAVFSTVIVPIAVVGLLAYGAYDTVTRLGKAYGDYKKKNKLSDADVRDNVVKGIGDFFTGGEKQTERMPVARAAVSKDLTSKYVSKKTEAIKQSVAKNDFTVRPDKQPTKSEPKGNLGVAVAAGTVAGVAVGASLAALGAPVIAAGMATAAVASLGATVAYQYGDKISGALSNIPIIGDIFFPKKAAASDLSAMQSTAKKEQAKLDQMKSLNNRQRSRDNTFSEEYQAYEERVEKPEGNAVTRFFGGIWRSIKEAGQNLTSALFKTKKGIEREVINIAKWLRGGGIQRVLGMVGDAIGGAIDSIRDGLGGAPKGLAEKWVRLAGDLQTNKNYFDASTVQGRASIAVALSLGFVETPHWKYEDFYTKMGGNDGRGNAVMMGFAQYHQRYHAAQTNTKEKYIDYLGGQVSGNKRLPGAGNRRFNQAAFIAEVQAGTITSDPNSWYAGLMKYGMTANDWDPLDTSAERNRASKSQIQALIDYIRKGGKLASQSTNASAKYKVTGGRQLTKADISSKYGMRPHPILGITRMHAGVDVNKFDGKSINGANISYTKGGVVTFAGTRGGYGYSVEIRHADGSYSFAAHLLNKPNFKKGETIQPGQIIGQIGSTGLSTGPHLHWERRDKNYKIYDPSNDIGMVVLSRGKVQIEGSTSQTAPTQTSGAAQSTGKTLYGHKSYAETKEKKASVGNGIQMGATAAAQFNLMAAAAKKEGLNLVAISGFRSIKKQEELFNNKVARVRAANPRLTLEQAKKEAAKVVAPAGYSEHATGNAIDILNRADGQLTEAFAKTKEYAWLVKNAEKFGYVLSFPKGNKQGVAYEPWHWEYEGVKSSNQVAQQPVKQNKAVATNLKNQLNQIPITALSPIVNMLFKGEGGVESINVIQRDSKGNRIAGRASTFQAEFGKSASETTLAEIRARQQQKGVVKGKSEIGAVGFPQFIGNTLGKAMATLGVTGDTKFTKQTQEDLLKTLIFIKRPEIGAYLTGQKGATVVEAAQALAREMASVGLSYPEAPAQQLRDSNSPVKPEHERKRQKGQSLYDGVNANKAHITPEEAQRQLKAARDLVMKSLNGKEFVMPNIAFGEGGEMANLAQQAADSYKDLSTVSQSVGSPTSQLQQLIAGLSPYAADQLLKGNFSIPFIRSLSRQVRANLSLLMSNPGELIKKAFAGVGNAVSAGVDAVKDALGFSGENIQVEGGTKLTKANINSRYGPRGGRMHRGVDVAAVNGRGANGLYISFALGGKVIDIANDPGGWGNNALVELANGVRYRIAHMQERPYIKVGQTFNAGQAIGRVGSTGRSTGPHLHFEKLGPDGKQVDPTNDIGVVILGGSKSVGVRQAGTNQPSKPPAPKPTPDKTSSVIEKQKQEKVAQSMQKPETDNTAAMNAIASIKGQLPPEQADLIQQFLEQAEIVSDQKAREVVKAKATRVVVIEKPDEVADTNSGYKVAVQGKRHKVGATAQPVIVKSQDGDREVYRYIHMESEAEVQYASINPYGGVDQNTMNAHSHNTSTESVPSSGNNQHGGYKEVG